MMIGADEHGDVFAGRALDERGPNLRPNVGESRAGAGQRRADLVAVGRQMPEQDLAAIWPSPAKEVLFLARLATKPPPQDSVFQPELSGEGGQHRRVAERIGRVQDIEASAQAFRVRGA